MLFQFFSVGCPITELHDLAVKMFKFSLSNSVSFQVQWIPRSENEKVDYLSRLVDPDDWSLNLQLFKILSNMWGPFDIGRMSDHLNAQLPRFNSKFWCPGTEAVDCFTKNWSYLNNWICSPPALVPFVFKHMETCNAKGVVLVPEWKSAPFWPIICPYPPSFSLFVKEVYFYLWDSLGSSYCGSRFAY